jgi:hypothetical protein
MSSSLRARTWRTPPGRHHEPSWVGSLSSQDSTRMASPTWPWNLLGAMEPRACELIPSTREKCSSPLSQNLLEWGGVLRQVNCRPGPRPGLLRLVLATYDHCLSVVDVTKWWRVYVWQTLGRQSYLPLLWGVGFGGGIFSPFFRLSTGSTLSFLHLFPRPHNIIVGTVHCEHYQVPTQCRKCNEKMKSHKLPK